MRGGIVAAIVLSVLSGLHACGTGQKPVVVYTSLDRHLSEPILAAWEDRTGVRLRAVYDVEASKTVGLANRIIAERERPRADVFWNSEVIHTIRLQREGLLAVLPDRLLRLRAPGQRSKQGYWIGFAGRLRVLIVNHDLAKTTPSRLDDFTDPRWRRLAAFANPEFGTTGAHFSALFLLWGKDRFQAWVRAMKRNEVLMLPGNAQVRDYVARGGLAFGLTDSDDANAAIESGKSVRMVLPDQGAGRQGTLLIPNTLSILAGAPNPDAAAEFLEYLLSAAVEDRLAAAPGAQIPLGSTAAHPPNLPSLDTITLMSVDFEAVADAYADMLTAFRDAWSDDAAAGHP